ncbi:hypothetical protein WN48_07500 [Eufriesea mexicana]|uniref:Uncharacterized protein n=1 Tax=Eufriesea mexicana TaxID=516756 RepID=A0A310SNG1_9HYME|nr:hypothetical protein WN48_07500 [Eufriesea mexicana]
MSQLLVSVENIWDQRGNNGEDNAGFRVWDLRSIYEAQLREKRKSRKFLFFNIRGNEENRVLSWDKDISDYTIRCPNSCQTTAVLSEPVDAYGVLLGPLTREARETVITRISWNLLFCNVYCNWGPPFSHSEVIRVVSLETEADTLDINSRRSWKMTGDPGSGSAGFEGPLIEFKRSARDSARTPGLQEARGIHGQIPLPPLDSVSRVIYFESELSSLRVTLVSLPPGTTTRHFLPGSMSNTKNVVPESRCTPRTGRWLAWLIGYGVTAISLLTRIVIIGYTNHILRCEAYRVKRAQKKRIEAESEKGIAS